MGYLGVLLVVSDVFELPLYFPLEHFRWTGVDDVLGQGNIKGTLDVHITLSQPPPPPFVDSI